jgi:phage tail-like protein
MNHNFLVSLLDTSSGLALANSFTLPAILDVVAGGFSECTGLEMSMKVEEYKEGGRNGTVLKFPNRVEWSAITLKKGLGGSATLWDWHYGFVEGRGKRRDGVIMLLTETRVPQSIWYFRRGLPVKYSGPSLNAMQNNVAIESIEIAHEGVHQLSFVNGVAGGGRL